MECADRFFFFFFFFFLSSFSGKGGLTLQRDILQSVNVCV